MIKGNIELEVSAAQCSIFTLGLIPDRHMRIDLLVIDQPAEYLCCPEGGITDQSHRLLVGENMVELEFMVNWLGMTPMEVIVASDVTGLIKIKTEIF